MFRDVLLAFGFSENYCKKIIDSHGIETYTGEALCRNFIRFKDYLLSLGYTKEEIIKIIKDEPTNIMLNIGSIKNKFNYLVTVGYKGEEVCKMWKKFPALITLTPENISTKIADMIEMGYTKEEILNMTRTCPALYSYNIDSMRKKFDNLVSLDFTAEESLTITKDFPDIFGLTPERIKEKIDFYDSIGLHEAAVEKPKYLMQSVELSYARYKFYKSRGYNINMSNYKLLFVGEKIFKNISGVSKETLLKRFDYSEYKERQKANKKEM